jgi:hypothetical protein
MRSQYASVSIGYQDFLFLDGTLRRDYSSTLKEDNNKYLYPSVSAAFIFSKLYSPEWLSLGKFRLNYAEVGSGTGYDQLINTYVVNQPMNGANNANPAVKKNPDLVPERTKSWETGLEMNFFDSRLGVDIALYKSNSYNQIMTIPISQTAGYSSLVVNAGDIENKGVEIAITGTPVRKGDFRWDVMLNWSKNKNMVVELYSDPTTGNKITNLVLGSFQGGITINATEGQPYGVIKGKDYTYDANGNKIISAASGLPVKSTTATEIIGNNTPDYLAGLNNAFSYKNVTLSFLIDMQKGGDIFSLDMYYGMSSGLYPETAGANDLGNPVRDPIVGDPGAYGAESGGYIIEGVNVDANGVSTPNQTRVDATTADGWGYAVEPQRAFVYDASYVKLREVALSYSLPSDLLKKTFLKGVTLSAVGSNLWIMSKNLPYADPESGLSAGNLQGYTIGSLPTTRDFSFNLKLNF